MKMRLLKSVQALGVAAVPLALCVTLSGCTLFGLGATAGAVVGGCALLDENQDNQVTQAELSQGVFTAWDTNRDGQLSQTEFEAGTNRGSSFDAVANDFNSWDTNNDGALTQEEFSSGVTTSQSTLAAVDDTCDDLGL